ncbi:MAG: FadR/GntR family transcriptional regulator, partial [Intestinibacter bartlettii]
MEYKKSQSLSEQVADEILDMIVVKKQFKIGDKLPNETELSALLNVSRTTLREAIKMLVLQDIVEIK